MPASEFCSASKDGLWFSIYINNDQHIVFVSSQTLRDCFAATEAQIEDLELYRKNKERIQQIAIQRFLEGQSRPVRLRPTDFAN